jgi:hypothetical protein
MYSPCFKYVGTFKGDVPEVPFGWDARGLFSTKKGTFSLTKDASY